MKKLPKPTKIDKRADVVIHRAPEGGNDDLLDSVSTAAWLGVSRQWLELARHDGFGPPFIKVTQRMIRYRKGDVLAYLKQRTQAARIRDLLEA